VLKQKRYEFEAEILKHPKMDAGYIEFPYDVEKEFATRGQVRVKAWFDGQPYRGSLAKMGTKMHCLGVTKAVRQTIGKNPGDTVHVVIQKDEEERTLEIPPELQEWLEGDGHEKEKDHFDELSYTHRKEYVQWITEAKKPETRERRLQKTYRM